MDSNKLIRLTNFPLTVRGYLDWDPTIKVSECDFFFIFDIFLNSGGGGILDVNNLDDFTTNNLDFIKRTLNAERTIRYRQNFSYQQIEQQVFEKIEGQWMLVLIFIDTRELVMDDKRE